MGDSLTSKTLRGLNWSYLSTIVNSALQIGFTAVLARLLEPSAFGLVAMAGVILRFGSYFSQMGIGSALIQKKELSPEDIRAAFTSTFLLGLFFFGLIWTAAPLAVHIFDNKELIVLLRVMGLSFVLTGFSTTALSLLRRNLAFRSLAIIDIVSFGIGYGAIGVLMAYSGFGVWSLVAGALCQNAISGVLSYLFNRYRVWFIYRWKHFRPLYSFGSRVSVIGFFEFIGSNLDTLAIGHFLGAPLLGIYNRAFMLVNLPMQYVTSSFSRVLFPSYSRIQEETPRLKRAYLSSILLVGSFLLPTCTGIAVASREIVLVVLGEKWIAAIPVLSVLAIGTPLSLLSHLGAILCEARAVLNLKLIMQSVYLILLAVLFYFLSSFGLMGFAIAVVIGAAFLHFAYLLVMMRILNITLTEIVRVYSPALFSSVIVGSVMFLASTLLRGSDIPVALVFAVQLVIGGALLILLLFSPAQRVLRREIQERLEGAGIVVNESTVAGRFLSQCMKILVAH
jgi:lipopolysaccharide exporter